MTKPKLTARQAMFVSEFLAEGNATQAAIRAGYSVNNGEGDWGAKPCQTCHRSRDSRSASKTICSQRHHSGPRAAGPRGDSLCRFPQAVRWEWREACPLHEIDDDTRAALIVEVTQGTDADGNPAFSRKVKFADKLQALDRLARHLGLLVDKVKVSGDAENPLQMLIQRIQGSAIKPVHEGRDEEH